MQNTSQQIKRAVIGELLRIILFVIYYIFHIALGIGLFVGAFFVSKYSLLSLASEEAVSGGLILFVLVANIAVWLLAAMVGVYLIKPLFTFTKNRNPMRVEVTERECPKLFAMIRSVATAARCPMPKHVYLSPDVNACVFYDTSFWSIFFPVQKNLEIGLGMFDGLNVSEIETIIGHEFGHFAQDSMKVGSAVYVVNTILNNLVCADDRWDNTIRKMRSSGLYSVQLAGNLTHRITDLISRNTARVYDFVQRGYLKLSRYMELDADSVACHAVGSEAFISALAKLEIASYEEEQFRLIHGALIGQNKTVEHYFSCKQITDSAIPRYGTPRIDHLTLMTAPYQTRRVKSKVQIEQVWSSHPATEERIAKAREHNVRQPIDTSNAWSLIPAETQDRVSRHLLGLIANERSGVTPISDADFRLFAKQEIKRGYMREDLAPFLNRQLLISDSDTIDFGKDIPSPFNEANKQLITQFNTLVNDYRLLAEVRNKQIDVRQVIYDGVVYKRNNLPLEQMKAEHEVLLPKIKAIDKAVIAYLYLHCQPADRQRVVNLFNSLRYADHMKREVLPDLEQYRNELVDELNSATHLNEEEFNERLFHIQEFEKYLKQVTSALNFDCMREFITPEGLDQWRQFICERHDYYSALTNSYNPQALSAIIAHADSLLDAFSTCDQCINGHLALLAETFIRATQ